MTRSARVKAFAKLNLGLRILFRREDGFHELRTVFQTISLADRLDISFTAARATTIEIAGAHIENNIVARAAELLLSEMKMHASVQFGLQKKIPAGAGLGGGSSDAAAVLLALPVLAGRRIPPQRLAAIAGELGSDVPFFLCGGTALGIGRGEEIYPMPTMQASHAVIVAPAIHSSTAQAYADLSLQLTPPQPKIAAFQTAAWTLESAAMDNDFEPVIFARHPQLLKIRNRLRKLGASTAAMTGSGSALFGIFNDPALQASAMTAFSNEQAFAISFLSRTQYRAAWKRALKPHTKGDQWPPQSLYAR